MEANKLRKLYLDFFTSKQHKVHSSAPIVVKNDPTLMFTNAGMNQFKDIFLGESAPKEVRVANSQKCLRVSGKHNDLEEVGYDTYHHTMFEMLGSWSFGDYFKENAIDWAWDFLVNVCHLDVERLYVTVFEGSVQDKLEKDIETYNFWKKYLSEDRILDGNKHDNFWEMGEAGPCGPCSEIHYDNRDDSERAEINGGALVNKDHPQVIEIWNLVFMQYNRSSNKLLKSLPKKHVDTGMGFERLAMIMQGVKSNYDTDIFQPIIQAIATEANVNYGEDEKQDIAMRVIADHIRAVSFSISDGQLPSNVKAGYVIRRILRRAVRYGYTFLNMREPFMFKLVSVLATNMGIQFPEISEQKDIIQKVIKEEEQSFLKTLQDGLKRIEHIAKKGYKEVSGEQVFELYDTYGFPVDLTALIFSEKGLVFNQVDFEVALEKQKERSRNSGKIDQGDWIVLMEDEKEEFVGYNHLETVVQITKYREINFQDQKQYQLVFNVTPFYPEGGGQVGDAGVIQNSNETISIVDTKKENKLIVHFVNVLPNDIMSKFTAKVNVSDRNATSRNHTATHLLHECLKVVLGEHVVQKGSLVNSSYLRFDFTHFSKIEKAELQKIELEVNAKILQNIVLHEHVDLPLSAAKELGAIMLFGEKYGDVVRMIEFSSSKELCGGTHVSSTGQIGLFKILSEGSISSGIRRIEAVTGGNALDYLNKQVFLLDKIRNLVKNHDLIAGVEQLVLSNKQLEKKLADLKKEKTGNVKEELLKSIEEVNDIRFIAKIVEMEAEDMKNISFQLRNEVNLVVVLAAKTGNKALLSVMLTDDLVAKELNANVMIRQIAKEINGGGGGQAFFATAGGNSPERLEMALNKAKELIEE